MKNPKIEIVSGEGEIGTVVPYTGKLTVRALKSRLTRERAGGDRWAFIQLDGQKFDPVNIIWYLKKVGKLA